MITASFDSATWRQRSEKAAKRKAASRAESLFLIAISKSSVATKLKSIFVKLTAVPIWGPRLVKIRNVDGFRAYVRYPLITCVEYCDAEIHGDTYTAVFEHCMIAARKRVTFIFMARNKKQLSIETFTCRFERKRFFSSYRTSSQ